MPSVRGRRRVDPGHPGDRRQHGGELRQMLVIEPARRLARQLAVERVNQKRERQVALELGCASGEYEVVAFLRAGCELREQTRFADPGFAAQADRTRRAALHSRERTIEHAELVPAPYECVLRRGHDGSVAGGGVRIYVTEISLQVIAPEEVPR